MLNIYITLLKKKKKAVTLRQLNKSQKREVKKEKEEIKGEKKRSFSVIW